MSTVSCATAAAVLASWVQQSRGAQSTRCLLTPVGTAWNRERSVTEGSSVCRFGSLLRRASGRCGGLAAYDRYSAQSYSTPSTYKRPFPAPFERGAYRDR